MSKKGNRLSQATNVNIVSTPRGVRSSMSAGGGSMSMQRTNIMMGQSMHPQRAQGEMAALGKRSVESVKDTRMKEKGHLSGLNQKLAEQMEGFSYIKTMNKQLQMELERWKQMKTFDDSCLKDVISAEIEELQEDLKLVKEKNAELETERLKLKDQAECAQDDCKLMKSQRDNERLEKEKLARINCEIEQDILKLRMENEFLESKLKNVLEELNNAKEDVARLSMDLQEARREQLNEASEFLAKKDEYEYELSLRDAKIEELADIIKKLQAVQPDYSKMWESQFKQSLMQLQQENDARINQQMGDMQRNYELKLARIQASVPKDQPDSKIDKTTTRTLKSELGTMNQDMNDLKRKNEALRRELADLQSEFERQCEECEREKADLRDDLEKERCDKDEIEEAFNQLLNDKGNLEMEIATYSSLLNTGMKLSDAAAESGGYQTRGGSMASQAIMSAVSGGGGGAGGSGGGSSSQQSNPVNKEPSIDPTKKEPAIKQPTPGKGSKPKPDGSRSETTGRMTISKQGSGGMIIEEVAADGSCVRILNEYSKDKDIGGYYLLRTGISKSGLEDELASYTFPAGTMLRSKSRISVYANNYDDLAKNDSNALIANCRRWGSGSGKCTLSAGKGQSTIATTTIKYT